MGSEKTKSFEVIDETDLFVNAVCGVDAEQLGLKPNELLSVGMMDFVIDIVWI